jgi:hypothetical protein
MLASNELISLRVTDVDDSLLVAMCVNASQANAFFCCGMQQYREAMDNMMQLTHVKARDWLNRVTPTTGFRRGQVPKFVYNPSHIPHVRVFQMFATVDHVDEVMFACDWGLAQLPGWWVVQKVEPQFRSEYLRMFLGDVNMQMREFISLLAHLLRKHGGDETEAVEQFHYKCNRGHKSVERAARDVALAIELRERADLTSTRYTV